MRAFFLLIVCLASTSARACLWDYDTLRDERRGLPGVAEILAGRFERHSAFFYADRVERMNALLARDPANLAAWDNLAVAYAKLGQLDRAIATIRKKDAIAPDQYTTHSNLGTFKMFAGDNAAAIVELKRALANNPNAHFGRERYQVMLAEYLLAGERDPGVFERGSFAWPIATARLPARLLATAPATEPLDLEYLDFTAFHFFHSFKARASDGDANDAIAGVIGMIRFGTDESPHLYAALGDLLASRGDFHLAYRAYARARDAGHPAAKWITSRLAACKRMAASDAEYGDDVIAAERTAGIAWVGAYQRFEDGLIRAGKNPDDETLLAPFYAAHGTAQEPLGWPSPSDVRYKLMMSPWGFIGVPVIGTFVAWWAVSAIRRRSRHRANAPAAGVS